MLLLLLLLCGSAALLLCCSAALRLCCSAALLLLLLLQSRIVNYCLIQASNSSAQRGRARPDDPSSLAASLDVDQSPRSHINRTPLDLVLLRCSDALLASRCSRRHCSDSSVPSGVLTQAPHGHFESCSRCSRHCASWEWRLRRNRSCWPKGVGSLRPCLC